MKMTNICILLALTVILSGCEVLNLGEILVTPTYGEQKIPAEYDLKANSEGEILIFVEGSPSSGSSLSLEDQISKVVKSYMVKRAKIKDKYVFPLSRLSMARGNGDSLKGLSPVQIGKKLNKSLVLHVIIDNNQLYQMSGRGYYDGTLVTRTRLFDVETGQVLWPDEKGGRIVKTHVELETAGRKAASQRLQSATGHCIVRSLYNCIRNKYRIKDEVENFDDKKYW
jgi:hypothetical protein